jgi:LysR family glycine cleavage system transcriptional activator
MRRRLPSLTALRAFEAVGRTGSVRAAGDELSVCHSAISRHIKNLQSELGIVLLRPNGRGVLLADEALDLFEKVSASLDVIEGAVDDLRKARQTHVRIWCVPGLANRRLLARLPELTGPPCNWEVLMHPTLQRPNLLRREADAEIIYLKDADPAALRVEDGIVCEPLARPRVFPVASPAFVARYPNMRQPHDLRDAALIHEESVSHWANWFRSSGLPVDEELPGQRLWHAHLAIEAACLGQGLALANDILVHDELNDGTLVEPFPSNIQLGCYAFVATRDRWSDPVIVTLRDWARRVLTGTPAVLQPARGSGSRRATARAA